MGRKPGRDGGYSVNHAWVTEGIAPGVVACSHHLGRWRRAQDRADRWNNSLVDITREESGWKLRQVESPGPFESEDPDTSRIFWSDGGVHQNLTFPVHPDPVSGMHCWHQAVYVEKARPEDVYVDTEKSEEVYRRWLAMTRPGPSRTVSGVPRFSTDPTVQTRATSTSNPDRTFRMTLVWPALSRNLPANESGSNPRPKRDAEVCEHLANERTLLSWIKTGILLHAIPNAFRPVILVQPGGRAQRSTCRSPAR